MNYLQYIDSDSKNVENLRKARTFNDLTGIIATIKGSVNQIKSKILKKLSSLKKQKISVSDDTKVDFSSLNVLYNDVASLRCFGLELEYAKSVAFNINGENKKQKFDKLVSEQISEVNNVLNMVYKYIDSIGSMHEPKELVQFSNSLQKYLSTYVKYDKLSTFVLPTPDKNTSFNRHIILFNVVTQRGFIIPNIIICISAETNFANGYFYTLSFPREVETKSTAHPFSNKDEMTKIMEDKLVSIIGTKLQPVKIKKDQLYKIKGIDSVYTSEDSLVVGLESGINASEVNNILTKLLPMMYSLTGVSNTRTDVLHRVGIGENGNRIIEFVLRGRTLSDRSHLSNLKKILPLNSKTVSTMLNILES